MLSDEFGIRSWASDVYVRFGVTTSHRLAGHSAYITPVHPRHSHQLSNLPTHQLSIQVLKQLTNAVPHRFTSIATVLQPCRLRRNPANRPTSNRPRYTQQASTL
jgi:hypothetical protein